MLETIARNPMPAVLVGLGMYWLLKNPSEGTRRYGGHSLQDHPQEYGMTPGETALEGKMKEGFQLVKNQVQEHVTDWKDQAGQQAQQWKEQAGYHAQQWKEQASQKAYQWKEETGQKIEEVKGYIHEQSRVARHEFNSLLENNPLAMGAVMVAVGAAVAAALPGSRREDQWMGSSRDRWINAVKTTVQSAVEDVTHKTGQVAQNVLKDEERHV